MHVRRVTTVGDVELLRKIRNSCASYMTHDTSQISREEQFDWWLAEDREAYLFDAEAFAYLSERDEKIYITLGMFPECRGKGLGTEIYAFIAVLKRPDPVWADVRHDNVPSINAAAKAGWKIVYVDGHKVVMHS